MTATYLETRDVPLTALTKYPGNAKRGRVEEIRASVRRHGQYRSLVVRFEGDKLTILAGNHTFDAITAEGHDAARCEIVECDDDTARRINIADNRTADIGEYDDDALAAELALLDGDYDGTGYTDEQAAAILEPPAYEEGASPGPPGAGGPATLTYQIVFDNDVQQAAWLEFLGRLRRQYPDMESVGSALHAYVGSLDLATASH